MKKITIVTLVTLLLVTTIIAQVGISLNNREINTLTKTQTTALENINLKDYNTTDYELDGKYKRCLNKKNCVDSIVEVCDLPNQAEEEVCENVTLTKCYNVINSCSNYITNESLLDEWEENKIGRIANVTIQRNNIPVKVREGVSTIK